MEEKTFNELYTNVERIAAIVGFMDDDVYARYGILIEPFLDSIKEGLEEEEEEF
ncbi:MAG: hypothetical protein GY714_03305 [Desulfobacterales bacterium]|nr:hypothetical protein [Desulfobacterales bacterium]MCP4162162.1 hypothetical protein [Deltaproteobacteria bacterium]